MVFDKEYILDQSLKNRYFEYAAAEGIKNKIVNPPIYLSVGTEHIPPILHNCLISLNIEKAHIFTQHRCHSYYLTFSQDYRGLMYEICGRTDGAGYGYTGSASLHYQKGPYKLYGHDGLLGSQVGIATGFAHASNELTICILGDAAAEEDYALGAFGYAITKKCPILFICEDNNLSLLTTKVERRSWDICDVVESMGYLTITSDDESGNIHSSIQTGIKQAINNKPTFVNIAVYRHLWHAGWGSDGEVNDWLDGFVRDYDIENIEVKKQFYKSQMDELWKQMYR